MILVLLAVALLSLLGLPLAILLGRDLRRASIAGVSFLLGSGLACALLFVLSMFGIKWSLPTVLTGSLALAIAFSVPLVRRRPLAPAPQPSARFSFSSVTFDLMTVICVVNHGIYAVDSRLWSWERWVPLWRRDFWGIWGLKAKLFLEAGGVDWSVLEQPLDPITHPDYPLLVPLALDYVALIAGPVDNSWLGIFFTAFGAALLLILRDLWIEETGSPVLAALATLAMTPAALTVNIGLAEGLLVAYSGAALLLMRRALMRNNSSLLLPAILLGLAGLTKNEGISLTFAVVVALLLQPLVRPRVGQIWPAFALMATWWVARLWHGLTTDLFAQFSLPRVLSRLAAPGELLGLAEVPSLEHQLFWFVIALSLALATFERLRRELLLIATVAVQLLFFAGSYLISPHSLGWHVSGSWGRLVAQLAVPLSFVALRGLLDQFGPRSEALGNRVESPSA